MGTVSGGPEPRPTRWVRAARSLPIPSRRLLGLLAVAAALFLLSTPIALAADAALLILAFVDWRRTMPPGLHRETPPRLPLMGEASARVELRNIARRRMHVLITDDLSEGLERVGGWREVDLAASTRRAVLGVAGDRDAENAYAGEERRDLETPEDSIRLVVPARSYADVTYDVRAPTRGTHVFGAMHTRVRGPWGLAWRQFREEASAPLRVQPGVEDLRKHRLSGLRSRLARAGLRRQRQWGEGSAFESLREYQEGDDPRSIDWKASARREQIIARRYQTERSQNVMLVIDAGRLMTERIDDRERVDHALSAALMLTEAARTHGDRVGVMVFDAQVRSFLPPTTPRLSRVADLLAGIEARVVEPNYPFAFTYLARHLRRRSLIVLFTDVIDARASAAMLGQLARTASSHLPLIVALRNPGLEEAATAAVADEEQAYRRAAAEELLRARAVALEGMRRVGVLVVDAEPGQAVPEAVSSYLEVKRRGRL